MKINSEIRDYIEYYIGVKNPGYAIFIDGQWGCGKTWFIESIINKDKDNFVYVSLYGLSTLDQVHEKIFIALHPIAGSSLVKIGSGLVKTAFKMSSLGFQLGTDVTASTNNEALTNFNLNALFKKYAEKTYVFDDFERTEVPQSEVLGLINTLVEHEKLNVVLIGHEEEIGESEEFQRKKEKVIGRSFRIVADFDATFSSLLNEISDLDAQRCISENKLVIQNIFIRSSYQNMRTLRYCLLEFQRFFSFLPDYSKVNSDFIRELINSLFSISIELKKGGLDLEGMLEARQIYTNVTVSRVTSKADKIEISKRDERIMAILSLHFHDRTELILPSIEVIANFLRFGTISEEAMESALSSTPYFSKEAPKWKRLWRFLEIEEEEFNKLSVEVWEEFTRKQYRSPTEILHVCSMFIFFSKNGLISKSFDTIKVEIDAVLDGMSKGCEIEILTDLDFNSYRFDESSHGLGYIGSKDSDFKAVVEKIKKYQFNSRLELAKKNISTLVSDLKSNSGFSFEKFTSRQGDNTELVTKPVLLEIDPNDFLDALKVGPAINVLELRFMLVERSKNAFHYIELREELSWYQELEKIIEGELNNLGSIKKYQFQELLSHGLKPSIERLKDYINQSKV